MYLETDGILYGIRTSIYYTKYKSNTVIKGYAFLSNNNEQSANPVLVYSVHGRADNIINRINDDKAYICRLKKFYNMHSITKKIIKKLIKNAEQDIQQMSISEQGL